MQRTESSAWKKSPFLRLLIPFVAGICTGFYYKIEVWYLWTFMTLCSLFLLGLQRLPFTARYRWRNTSGWVVHLLLFAAGTLMLFYHDIRHSTSWFGHVYQPGDTLVLSIDDVIAERPHTYHTKASVKAIRKSGQLVAVAGSVFLDLEKNSGMIPVSYGSRVYVSKALSPVVNTGNPGGFDYARYAAFQGIWHQVYLHEHEYFVAEKTQTDPVKSIIHHTREKILNVLRRYVPDKKQAGLAEALLIGYKEDMDKPLLSAYIETGVVHIIAVSGQHLGLIYGLLLFLCRPLQKGWAGPLRTGLLLAGIWSFALVAGGGPSILRAAVMFSCLLIGNRPGGRVSVYNALAASAFLLLCYHPLWLWDAGFQLSYAAVLSISLFMHPIYTWWEPPNKVLIAIWKIIAITLAAQVLTLPVSLWHFHRFPHVFLLANLVAVPLSGLILTGELLLCAVAFIPAVARLVGLGVQGLIYLMNVCVEALHKLPFQQSDSLQLSTVQLFLLYLAIGGLVAWWLYQQKAGLFVLLVGSWLCLLVYGAYIWSSMRQEQLVIYNVPRLPAMDHVYGRATLYTGDTMLYKDASLERRYLTPTRSALYISRVVQGESFSGQPQLYRLGKHSVLVLDRHYHFKQGKHKIRVDHIVLSRNPLVSVKSLINVFDCHSIVLDGSNSRWKTSSWEQECHDLGVSCHAVSKQGAFVLRVH